MNGQALAKFVYHRRPPRMQGDTLYPLNRLAKVHPQIHAGEVLKYRGRESLMEEKIPVLDCLWNDVLHCSPIHPSLVSAALDRVGCRRGTTDRFFQIPVSMLDPARSVIMLYRGNDHWYLPFDPDRYRELSAVPAITEAWYRECHAEGRPPLLFHGIPHILTAEPMDVATCLLTGW